MKRHSEYGWAVLRMLPGFERAALDILHHHESFDGKGYPAGLKDTEIPVVSRIVCVIDAFDANGFFPPLSQGACPTKKPCAGSVKRAGPSLTRRRPTFLPFAQAEMSTVFAAAGTSVFLSLVGT